MSRPVIRKSTEALRVRPNLIDYTRLAGRFHEMRFGARMAHSSRLGWMFIFLRQQENSLPRSQSVNPTKLRLRR